jgi:hypothetical protein
MASMAASTFIWPACICTSWYSSCTSAALSAGSSVSRCGCRVCRYPAIHQWPQRFDQVVGKVKGIELAFVLQAKRRQKAVAHQRAGDGGALDGVAVIQCAVDPAILLAGEMVAKQRGKVITGAGGLAVVAVAGSDPAGQHPQKVAGAPALLVEAEGLIEQLLLHDALPGAFFCGTLSASCCCITRSARLCGR